MATATLIQNNVKPWLASMRFAEIYSGALPEFPACQAPASTRKADPVCVSRAAALRGAKGALIALGLEAAAAAVALCFYGMWRL